MRSVSAIDDAFRRWRRPPLGGRRVHRMSERYGRARGSRPVSASEVTSGQQQRRSGIIAATCPAVRVRIIRPNPISKVGVASARTYRRRPGSVKPSRRRVEERPFDRWMCPEREEIGTRARPRSDPEPEKGQSGSGELALMLMYPRCSFCGATPPIAWYEGPDFVNSVPSSQDVRSEEAWLACSTCVRLVNEGDREALVLRSAQDTLMGIRENFDREFWDRRDSVAPS